MRIKRLGIRVASWMLLILLVIGVVPAGRVMAAPHLQVSVDFGYDGSIVIGKWMPVWVEISNIGDAVEGTVRVYTQTDYTGKETIAFETPVSLPQQAKKTVCVMIKPSAYQYQYVVEVISSTGNVVYNKKFDCGNVHYGDTTMAGLLVKDAQSAAVWRAALSGANVGSGMKYNGCAAMELTPDQLKMACQLSSFTMLYIGGIGVDDLSQQQWMWLRQWVQGGGVLVVGGGSENAALQKQVGGWLADFMLSQEREATRQELDQLIKAGDEQLLPNGKVLLSQPGATDMLAVLSDEAGVLVGRCAYGAGSVYFPAFDPSSAAMIAWNGQPALWRDILAYYDERIWNVDYQSQGYWIWNGLLSEVLSDIPEMTHFPFWGIVVVVLVYALLVGPVLYGVLRAKDKREWMWAAVPVMAILCMVGLFGMVRYRNGNQTVVRSTALVRLGEDQVVANHAMGVYVPQRGVSNLAFSEGVWLSPPGERDQGALSGSVYRQGIAPGIAMKVSGNWAMQAFRVDGEIVPSPGYATSTLDGTLQSIKGSITWSGEQPLENAMLIVGERVVKLGTLQPGQSVPVNQMLVGGLRTITAYTNEFDSVCSAVALNGGNDELECISRYWLMAPMREAAAAQGVVLLGIRQQDEPPAGLRISGQAPSRSEEVQLMYQVLPVVWDIQGKTVVDAFYNCTAVPEDSLSHNCWVNDVGNIYPNHPQGTVDVDAAWSFTQNITIPGFVPQNIIAQVIDQNNQREVACTIQVRSAAGTWLDIPEDGSLKGLEECFFQDAKKPNTMQFTLRLKIDFSDQGQPDAADIPPGAMSYVDTMSSRISIIGEGVK
nr:hypothetical protein [bacterium]